MSDRSPLFVSSVELLAHATELYAGQDPKRLKFVVLHLANAVELILKDLLLDLGLSIYKNPKETISIWDAFAKCEQQGLSFLEKPFLELLIDDRNVIQHRFGYPDSKTVDFYVQGTVAFFTRVLQDHYGLAIAEVMKAHLSSDHLALLGLVRDRFFHIRKLAEVSPPAAVSKAFSEVVRALIKEFRPSGKIPLVDFPLYVRFLEKMVALGYANEDLPNRFRRLRTLRNYASHGAEEDYHVEDREWHNALDTAQEFINGLQRAREDGRLDELGEALPKGVGPDDRVNGEVTSDEPVASSENP